MDYFLGHIGYMLILALVIAGLACVWAFVAAHNARKRSPEMQEAQEHACESCSLAAMCTRFGKENAGTDCERK
ncbi:MAG: hypothetical protein IJM69_09670 [Firmicutes bacterium]|nr:hypothetical protein [Bacillota bacterium]MBQ6663793.1 hypothetical protein [Bacillota bacterium]MCR4710838.1 hypothetical protein [Clostridia bacterium]MCR4711154.1 hypothetical protein [Clostridia bacterium]